MMVTIFIECKQKGYWVKDQKQFLCGHRKANFKLVKNSLPSVGYRWIHKSDTLCSTSDGEWTMIFGKRFSTV